MEDAHEARKHLGSHILIYLRIAFVVERNFCAEDMFREVHNFFLVVLALRKTRLGAIVEALLGGVSGLHA